jgi:predicted phosphodiesterase
VTDSEVAIIADIHGNIWALNAVLDDITRRGIHQVVNLGDSLAGPLDPAGVAHRLLPLNFPTVRGNADRATVEVGEDQWDWLRYTRAQLTSEQLEWLAHLPTTINLGGVLLCHGTPNSDETYLLEKVTPGQVEVAPTEIIVERLAGVPEAMVVCGHSHVPRTVFLPDGRMVVNAGSVGLPCYTQEFPHPHAMESYSPHAKYLIFSRDRHGWRVAHVLVPYDWRAAADAAAVNGRADWAAWLVRGRVEASRRVG